MKKIKLFIIFLSMCIMFLPQQLFGDEPPLCDGQPATIWGTEGDDILVGTDGPDVIHGLGGNDKIYGEGGDDIICGGEGHDILWGGPDEGDDRIFGGPGVDILGGGPGNDFLMGEKDHDVLWGNEGDDILDGGKGNDNMSGGDGADQLYGDWGNDNLSGGAGDDELNGGGGNDYCTDDYGTLIENCGPILAAVARTGQKESFAPGDDGDLRLGVRNPDPRFVDNGDGTVTDRLTGLIWLKNANCFGEKRWLDAISACNNLSDGDCGLSDGSSPGDWRLPNFRELESLVDYSRLEPALHPDHPFTNVMIATDTSYWTSTSLPVPYRWDSWDLSMRSGHVTIHHKRVHYHFWPVRGGNR